MKKLVVILSSLAASSCSVFGVNSGDTLSYRTLYEDKTYEIREYAPYLVAQVSISQDKKDKSSEAFRMLAGFIFGKNKTQNSISMTSPVVEKDSTKISMTSPVKEFNESDGYTMQFIMPKKFTLSTLPIPLNKKIQIKEVKAHTVAVLKYTWTNSLEKKQKNKEKLLKWIKTDKKYSQKGAAYFASYNPPWTIPFLKTNEVLIPITTSSKSL